MVCAALLGLVLLGWAECTHIFTLDEDFSRLKTDPALVKHVEQVLKRLKMFKVAVHPRIRLFYHLLKRGMVEFAHRTGDSFYMPYVYREPPAPSEPTTPDPPEPLAEVSKRRL